MSEEHYLRFQPMLPLEIQVMFPTTYSKLNLLNHCQYLKTFTRYKSTVHECEHALVVEGKLQTIRNIITQIIETDSVLQQASRLTSEY
nr:MAG: hypothetical protein ADFBMEEK_00016 [Peromyscus leucopus gammaherpesvirus]